MRLLLDEGVMAPADVMARSHGGGTALHRAAAGEHRECCSVLLEKTDLPLMGPSAQNENKARDTASPRPRHDPLGGVPPPTHPHSGVPPLPAGDAARHCLVVLP